MPAHVAKMPPSNSTSRLNNPFLSISREMVVDSPPGMARASRIRNFIRPSLPGSRHIGRFASRTVRAASLNASICSLTSPWSARTPILAPTVLEHLALFQGMDIEPFHGFPKTFAGPGNGSRDRQSGSLLQRLPLPSSSDLPRGRCRTPQKPRLPPSASSVQHHWESQYLPQKSLPPGDGHVSPSR